MPFCQVCGALELVDFAGKVIPYAELWIPANEAIYAAPILIVHFIEVHNYLPPAEFIAAIDLLDDNVSFVADAVYREKLRQSEWGSLSGKEKMEFATSYNKNMAERD